MQYSIVNYKTVKENSDFRIDGEYYHPLYIEIESKLAEKESENLNDICLKIGRNPMAYGFDYVEKGIPYFRIDDLYNPIIDYSNAVYISEDTNQALKSTQLLNGDIVMGVRHKDYPLEGIQFHPESFLTASGIRILENFINL